MRTFQRRHRRRRSRRATMWRLVHLALALVLGLILLFLIAGPRSPVPGVAAKRAGGPDAPASNAQDADRGAWRWAP